MLLTALLGFILGFVTSMPVAGPIAILVLERGLHGQYRSGLLIAVGAAVPEAAYAQLAFWGVSAVLVSHPMIDSASRVVGAVILLALGTYFVLRQTKIRQAPEQERAGHSNVLLGLTIAALNPALIATWSAAVAALHSAKLIPLDTAGAPLFALGVGSGIVAWFAAMLALLRRHGHRLEQRTLAFGVRALGFVLVGAGLWLSFQAVHGLVH